MHKKHKTADVFNCYFIRHYTCKEYLTQIIKKQKPTICKD